MTSISDRLKSLGVKVGARDLPAPAPRPKSDLEQFLAGHTLLTPLGETFVVEKVYPVGEMPEQVPFPLRSALPVVYSWAGQPGDLDLPDQTFAFLDTETTGLSGGTGTYAFLAGVGRFEMDAQSGAPVFHLAQFFMRDPSEEPALLYALEQFLAPCQVFVTFNGKTFDMPLLFTRYVTQGLQYPFTSYAHIDLLHLARRLWKNRLPSRTLISLEAHILGAQRTEEDLPGYIIPGLYFQYLQDGDVTPLQGILYHNAMDIVSLARLLAHITRLLDDPFSDSIQHGVDVVALARLFEDLGDLERATRLYMRGIDSGLPAHIFLDALQRMASIHKRQEQWDLAIQCWEHAAHFHHLQAHIELAMYYEHRARDYAMALHWTENAIFALERAGLTAFARQQELPDLQRRLQRIQGKLGRKG